VGWADCIWSESEGFFRQANKSKETFRNRVYHATKKQFLWFSWPKNYHRIIHQISSTLIANLKTFLNNMSIQQNQAWQGRAEVMDLLIKSAFSGPISALEIGVWYGIGSTNIWLKNLHPASTLCLIDPWKPYASKEDLNDDIGHDYKQMDDLSTDAFLSTYLNVKKFQNEHAHRGLKISTIRAEAKDFLPLLKDDSFDFIYIDGDHKYDNVKSDIQQAKRLINKKYGVICGDDLDKLPTNELVEISKKFKNRDYLRGENEHFHPGVMLAVSEEFDQVNMVNGTWWIVCKDGKFDVELLKPTIANR
jgi:predicted O-methyltransferase YrrM